LGYLTLHSPYSVNTGASFRKVHNKSRPTILETPAMITNVLSNTSKYILEKILWSQIERKNQFHSLTIVKFCYQGDILWMLTPTFWKFYNKT